MDYENGFADGDGVKIHYIGKLLPNKPTILFIPGLMMPGAIWKKQLDYFSKCYSIVAIDPRSQGDSTQTSEGNYIDSRAKDIKAVIDHLKLKSVILVGWSLAVSEIVSYLNQFGAENVPAVILVDGLAGIDVNSPSFKMKVDFWSQFQKNRIVNTRNFVRGLFAQPQAENYLEELTSSALKTPTNTVMSLIYDYLLTDYRTTFPNIKNPTLIITFNAPWLNLIKEMQRLIPHSQLEIIENAGHALFVDQPQQFNQILEKFLLNVLQ